MPGPAGPMLTVLQLNSARLYVGEAAHTLNLTEALRRAGHAVLLGLREGHATHEIAVRRGLDPHGFVLKHRWWPSHDLPDMKKLARLVREHGVQVIHAHRGKDHWLAVLATRIHRLKIPVVRTRHVTTPLRNNLANRMLARRTARLIAVSSAVEADVRAKQVFAPEKVVRIPGGVDLDRFAPGADRAQARAKLELPAEARVAVCVARFESVKAHRVLLDAWKSVARGRPGAILLLVGDGSFRPAIEAQVQALELGASVRLLGRRDPGEIPGILAAADAGTLSSVGSEGFSRAVLEYMAMGLPVAATRVGAVPDLVEDGVNGKLAPIEDPAALAAILGEVLDLPAERRAAWGNAGRARAEQHHGYGGWAAAHERLYREVLSEHG
ncbi:MAG: glycosyltransferase [Planctomycetota bacterium]|nr:glycosyltransferase [Planctomycetota bacterium]